MNSDSSNSDFPNSPNQSPYVNPTDNLVTDPRLPSGEWSGFYLEDHQSQRGWMHLYINFQSEPSSGGTCTIAGEGTDYVAPWTIRGSCDLQNSVCEWTKFYLRKHQVNYRGKITENGIQGVWDIRGWRSGPFHIWPRSRTDLQGLYMKDELDANDPSILLGTVPLPPEDLV